MTSLWTGQWQGRWEGRLIGPIDPNFLTGTTGFSVAASGLVRGAGILAGQAYFAFDADGNIENGNTTVPADGVAGFSLSASGTVIGALLASGAATIVLDASGDAYLATNAAGVSALSVSSSGSLRGIGAVIGSGAVDLSAQAALRGVGSLSGASGIAVLPNGNIFSPLWATGQSGLSVGIAGDINGALWVSGDADLSVQASGLLHGIGALSGAAWVALNCRDFDLRKYQRVYVRSVLKSLFVTELADQIISVASVNNLSVMDAMQAIGVRSATNDVLIQQKRTIKVEKPARLAPATRSKPAENKPAYARAAESAIYSLAKNESIFSTSSVHSFASTDVQRPLFIKTTPRRDAPSAN